MTNTTLFSKNIMDTLTSLQNQGSFTFSQINPNQIKITKPNTQSFFIFKDNGKFNYQNINSNNTLEDKIYYDDEEDIIYSLINL